jgi:hypothetical protein
LKINKGFALLAIMAILIVFAGTYYDFGEVVNSLLTIGIVWATLYVALIKKLF